MSDAPVAVSLQGLTKRYGSTKALDNVSLEVPKGTFLTLLGPSGSGKTTLLMSIAGFVEPEEGVIVSGGRDIMRLPPERRNFGMVFQGYALFPHMTVRENVAFPLKVRRTPAAEIKSAVDRALDLVQLAAFADRLPKQLSGGQQQRVALARAIVFQPEVLLLDEPLSALDKKLRNELQVELRDLHKRLGITFIYVTHDQDEAMSMSDEVVIMRDGRLVQMGAPNEVYESPRTSFVASFLGRSNFIEAKVTRANGRGLELERGDLRLQVDAPAGSALAGEEMLLALRPEKVTIAQTRPRNATNVAQGVIRNRNYHGGSVEISVEVERVGLITATAPTWRCALPEGDNHPVWLSWDADAMVPVDRD